MEYLTTSEVAEIWGITRRRVNVLCNEGRIEGVIQKGKIWLIPNSALKPEDGRHFRHLVQKDGLDTFSDEVKSEYKQEGIL